MPRLIRRICRQAPQRCSLLDTKTLGVGSNSCGPKPLPQYMVWSDPTEFSYVLRLLPAGDRNLSDSQPDCRSHGNSGPAALRSQK